MLVSRMCMERGGYGNGGMICFFFFSSRRRHTRSLCDWSSDVCSSDLCKAAFIAVVKGSTSKPLTSKSDLLLGKEFSLDSNVGL